LSCGRFTARQLQIVVIRSIYSRYCCFISWAQFRCNVLSLLPERLYDEKAGFWEQDNCSGKANFIFSTVGYSETAGKA